jgi:gliding motility-associated-like protein
MGGNVTSDGGTTVTERGVVYNNVGFPTIANTKLQIGTGTGVFSQSLSGLFPSTTYHVRAYAINAIGIAYGNEISFTTPEPNRAPKALSMSFLSIDENVEPGTEVGTFSATDPDTNDTFTYTLVTGNGDTDNGSFDIVDGSLRIIISPDYEKQNSYSIRVRVTDQGGLFFENVVIISILDLEEPVVIPNVCFPNGNQLNTTWGISHLGIKGKTNIKVFDSRGQVIFSTDDPNHEWDGTNGGKQVPEDVYFYSITLSDGTRYEGTLQVIY